MVIYMINIKNNMKHLKDIEIFYRINMIFERGLIDNTQKKQLFSFNDGCNIEITYYYNKISNILITYNPKYKRKTINRNE